MTERSPTGRRDRAWLVVTLTVPLITATGALQERPGVTVEEVRADSPAAKVGLRPADRVLRYDAKTLTSPAALQAAEENAFDTPSSVLEVQRGDETRTLVVPPGRLGIQVRPSLADDVLRRYEQGKGSGGANEGGDTSGWSAAADAAQAAGDTTAAAWLHSKIAELREARGQWKDASGAHAAALALWARSGDAAAQSRALVALARCSRHMNDFPAAVKWLRQAEEIDATAGREMWVAGDLDALGDVAYTRGDLNSAQDYFSRALTIRERLAPDSLEAAASRHNLGNVSFRRGDLVAAEEAYRRALSVRDRLAPDSLDVASSLNNLGNLAVQRGDLASANSQYERALRIRERLAPGSLSVATTLSNLGVATHGRGDLASAENYYKRALAIRERLAADSLDVATSLTNLGAVATDRGDAAAAGEYHRRALGINGRLAPDSLSVALSLFNLGNVSKDRGEFAAADDYFRRSLSIRERLAPNSIIVAISLNHLGKVARERGDLQAALDYQTRALALHEQLAPGSTFIGVTLSDLGMVERSRGNLPAARGHLQRALALRERLAPDSLIVAESLTQLGGIALDERRFDEALGHFERSVDIIESQRWQFRSAEARVLLVAQHTESYAGLIRAQFALDDLPAAFATAERSRARGLLETLGEARAEIREGVDPLLLARERSIQQALNDTAYRQTRLLGGRHSETESHALQRQLDALLVEYREVQSQLRVKSPRYAALTQPRPLDVVQVQRQLLDAGTVLLEYALGEPSSHLFVVTPTSIKGFELPGKGAIEQAARRVYELLVARQPVRGELAGGRMARIAAADAKYPAAAAALSRMVLGPVAGELSNKRLLIVADGALQYVPFAALPEPRQAGLEAPPLVITHEIVNVPSASVLAVLREEAAERRPAERLVAVVADPVFDGLDPRLRARTGADTTEMAELPRDLERAVRSTALRTDRGALSRLPFTRDEARAIRSLAPAGESTVAIDFDASRAAMTSAEFGAYRIVHLATHGIVSTEQPELSGLVFSLIDRQGQSQDGFLRLHDVYNLNWSAELVVLSACQTALGKEIKGEGLVGLTRGFMYGGAKRVVASLWNINDGATAQFMKQFYQGLLTDRRSPAAALRAAQIEMWKRKQWRSPYYWGAFVLQGEWR